jgi:hypothetical protein
MHQVRDDILNKYVHEISDKIQFPENSAYLFGLGAVASAMVKSFSYDYHGSEKPVTIYCVSSQPPSTGKSGIVDMLADPVRFAYEKLNAENKDAQLSVNASFRKAEKDLAKTGHESEDVSLQKRINELHEEMEQYPTYKVAIDDATPEALAQIALNQGGMFSVVSAEADIINVMLGTTYSGKENKTNHSVLLKGWDGEYYSPARITRETKSGKIKGCFCVLAQDESIRSILEAGLSGRGISERILLLREQNKLGTRKHSAKRRPINKELMFRYNNMIASIVCQKEPVVLRLSDESYELLSEHLNKLEPRLADGDEYSHAMLRGFIGKADKHICKIASVIHTVKEWDDFGQRKTVIELDTMTDAVFLFMQLSKIYIEAADSQGFIGVDTQTEQVLSYFKRSAEKGKLRVTMKQVRDAIKNAKVMQGVSKISQQLKLSGCLNCVMLACVCLMKATFT